MKQKWGVTALAALCLGAGMPATAWAQTTDGEIRLDVDVPEGGVALVELRDAAGEQVLRSVVVDADRVVTLSMPAGTYRVLPRRVAVHGERFVGRSQSLVARVGIGTSTTVDVDYTRSLGVQALKVTEIGRSDVTVDWEAELGDDTTVWRLEGDDAPTRPGQGTQVTLRDTTSFVDSGLTPGGVYTYSIFARPGDGSFGRDDVDPVSITVSTEDDDPATPLFVLSPGTRILDAADFTAFSTGSSLVLQLAAGVPTPTPGTIYSVPVTAALPGGFLGEVVAVSADGRKVELVAAALASAFDLYSMDVQDISALPDPQYAPAAPPEAAPDGGNGFSSTASGNAKMTADCGGAGDAVKIDPDFSVAHAAHGKVELDKYKIKYFPDVPKELRYDVGYSTTLSATVDVEATREAACAIDLPRFFKNVTLYPVPLAIDVEPKAQVAVFGKLSVQNFGGAVTAGFRTTGDMPLTGLPDLDGDLIAEGNATEPVATAEGGLNLAVNGSVTFGPGVGSKDIGVIFGVSGSFAPLDATASIVLVEQAGQMEPCVKVDAKYKAGISATLKAWVPGYEQSYTVPIDPLNGEWDYPGSPYFWPNDCTESGTPTNDVVGKGVTVISDDITGNDEQFGKVSGFVPGQGTWALSTGRIEQVVGPPSYFASTSFGGAGNAALSGLSGFSTYDAASYKVTLVPNGYELVVRYAFASEEYPEYAGTRFNDAMGVFVNGKNCALVPGTTKGVSINTINHFTNSQYYVDNTSGASGYGTTMDGLTVPLECRVPVTPGQQVTVEVAVADSSDHAYDSAIALLDGGIYSE
jgi:hypothetical protein